METRIGQRRIYHNFRVALGHHPEETEVVLLIFQDTDNEIEHVFEMELSRVGAYIELLREAQGKQVIIAHTMPGGPHAVG